MLHRLRQPRVSETRIVQGSSKGCSQFDFYFTYFVVHFVKLFFPHSRVAKIIRNFPPELPPFFPPQIWIL